MLSRIDISVSTQNIEELTTPPSNPNPPPSNPNPPQCDEVQADVRPRAVFYRETLFSLIPLFYPILLVLYLSAINIVVKWEDIVRDEDIA